MQRVGTSNLQRPVFIVSPPHSGATLLFDTLRQSPDFSIIRDFDPDAITEPMVESGRLLAKAPMNAVRIRSLHERWPDALFIYLYRDPRATISSMSESVEVAAEQWASTTNALLDDLEALPPDAWCVASYDALVLDPQREIERLSRFVGVRWERPLTGPLASLPPAGSKGDELDRVFEPLVAATAERAREVFARPPARRLRVPQSSSSFRSVYSKPFPEILAQLNASLVVSTYQSGRVVLLRADDHTLNTHFRAFPSPMGIAVGAQSIALGTLDRVWDYRNQPDLTQRLEPAGKHDACFVPRNAHVTGDIRIHEIAFDAGGDLWVVNTRFSALCTLDRDHSFIPRWRPPFVTHLSPDDRCHLNGVAIIDGRPRFATALGETNDPQGWRANKAGGGVLIDIDSGESIVRGLSMPHSPRWYAGRMWVLESGRGTLATIDLAKGRVETMIELPGFTRGLAFAGPYAFVGLSQVRESNVFGGIPLTERLKERSCGVWVVDLRSSAVVAHVRFEDAVQEIFDVQMLRGVRHPELLEPDAELLRSSYVLPDAALAEVAPR